MTLAVTCVDVFFDSSPKFPFKFGLREAFELSAPQFDHLGRQGIREAERHSLQNRAAIEMREIAARMPTA